MPAPPSRAISVDAPIDGWNVYDSLDNMSPQSAIQLDNLIPGAGVVDTRRGSFVYGDTESELPVETIASLDTDSDSLLIVASGGGIWDMTNSQVQVGAQAVNELHPVGTYQGSKWQTKNFRKADEEGILIMCNGLDPTQFLGEPYNALAPIVANDGSDPWSFPWVSIPSADVIFPASGEWNTNLALTELRIAWFDNNGVNRQIDLQALTGATFRIEDTLTPANWITFEVTSDYVEELIGYTRYAVIVTGSASSATGQGEWSIDPPAPPDPLGSFWDEDFWGAAITIGEEQTITGDTSIIQTNFIGCESFKGRMYYWYDDDDAFWFAQAGSYQGQLTKFNLGSVAQKGGKIVMITTWTQQDSGDGKDDFLVFIFSTGEILVYQGDDPETIGFFEMVGRYNTAEPLSIRGRDKYGADTIIMTQDGYIALSTIVQQGRISDVPAFSRLITGAITERTATRGQFYGWDCALFARQGLFVFNVPLSDVTFEQHVLNTVTQRWCRFKDINVNCIAVHDDRLFGGGEDGKVIAMLEGTADLGEPIYFTAIPAFQYLDNPGVHKHITAAQFISTTTRPDLIELTGLADFNFPALGELIVATELTGAVWSINPPSPPASVGSFWDEDFWWAGDNTPFTTKGWQNVSGFGYAVTVQVRFATLNEPVKWRSMGIRYHNAGAQ